jgi:hypothetical protein
MKTVFLAVSLSLNVIAIDVLLRASFGRTPPAARELYFKLAIYLPIAIAAVWIGRHRSREGAGHE